MNSISVVIPTYHRYDALRSTVADLLAQDQPPDEIIVVDNTDADRRYKPEFMSSTSLTNCVYISSSKTGRVNAARNEGLAEVSSDFVLFFDDDMSVPRDCITNFKNAHQEGADAVTGVIFEDGRILSTKEFGSGRPLWRLLRTQHGDSRGTTIGVPSGFVSVRTSILKEIGGFDETFIYNYDDYDLGLRLWMEGVTVVRDPRVRVTHLKCRSGGGRVISNWTERRLNKYRSKYYFLSKHFGDRARKVEICTDVILLLTNLRLHPFKLIKELRIVRKAATDPLFRKAITASAILFLLP